MKSKDFHSEIRDHIIKQLDAQIEKGVRTYGHTLDDCPDDKYDWQEMAMQEMIDLVQYQQKQIRQLKAQVRSLQAPTTVKCKRCQDKGIFAGMICDCKYALRLSKAFIK